MKGNGRPLIKSPRIYKMLLNTRAEDKTQEDTEIREIE